MQKITKILRLRTIAQICRVISLQLRHVSTTGKVVKQQCRLQFIYLFIYLSVEIHFLVFFTILYLRMHWNGGISTSDPQSATFSATLILCRRDEIWRFGNIRAVFNHIFSAFAQNGYLWVPVKILTPTCNLDFLKQNDSFILCFTIFRSACTETAVILLLSVSEIWYYRLSCHRWFHT